MAQRIEVGLTPGADDPRGNAAADQARRFLGIAVERVETRTIYKLSADLPGPDLEAVRRAITDPVLEISATPRLPLPPCDWVVAVGFLPGVTDNVGRTAARFIADVLDRPLPANLEVFTEVLYLLSGRGLQRAAVERVASELLANALIERVTVRSAADWERAPVDLALPLAGVSTLPAAEAIPLPVSDAALLALSRRRLLSLSLDEMHAIRDHFDDGATRARRHALGLPRDPTDVELEAIAQTWSEHCKHKIFNARICYREEGHPPEVIRSLFRTYIVEVTRAIGQRVDWLVSVFDDNAGVVRLNAETCLVFKVETHNSPSALDPYGGAMTGIVGVNRDPLGTGMGAALLANVWGYCLAAPDWAGEIPLGLLHPRRIREGVHRGVIDGGNQSGIPYARGFEIFDQRFLGKPLVFCGTVGVLPSLVGGRPGERKEVHPGDLVVMVGGRIGKDGIHGATFSSEALHAESPAQAVQIGDPITQKMMSDMLLEARDLGLYRALTDNGAGGLSSSVGELARLSGGAELDLDRAPLKYAGLRPWEILLSEAQERMTLAVPPEQLKDLLDLARRREVEATPIGTFTDGGSFRLRYQGEVVADLEMGFLHGGCPTLELAASWSPPRHLEPGAIGLALDALDPGELLPALLGRRGLRSLEERCRQYDHEVKGLAVIKPLVGRRGDLPADATVMRVAHGRPEAILLAEGIAPRLSDIDAGAMAAWVVDLAARRIVAGGGQLGRIAGLDNFCWPDPVQSTTTPDGEQKLAALVRACRALARMTAGLDLPCVSGKDSMKNDSTRGQVKISIPPTLLFSALGWMPDAGLALDCVPGRAGESVYLIGATPAGLGASELLAHLAAHHGEPDLVGNRLALATPEICRASCETLGAATAAGLVRSAHALHLGGLGIGLAHLGLAADLGLAVSLDDAPGGEALSTVELLFAEGGSRFLLTVDPAQEEALVQILARGQAPWARLGEVTARPILEVRRGEDLVLAAELDRLRTAFHGEHDER